MDAVTSYTDAGTSTRPKSSGLTPRAVNRLAVVEPGNVLVMNRYVKHGSFELAVNARQIGQRS